MRAKQKFLKGILLGATLVISHHSFPSVGAVATVLVGSGGLVYTPATTNIAINDKVLWSWSGSFHSTTSDQVGLWDSGVNNLPHSFTNTFTSAGTFPYHCTIHVGLGMRGTIIVQAPNVAPTVTITNPVNGAVLSAPATLLLAASAADSDGTVTNVEFFQGTGSLGNVTGSPYSVAVNNLAAGGYTFSAVASDDGGLTTTNSIAITVVTPVAILLTAPQKTAASVFQFSYTANVGLRYVVQRSTDLTSAIWTPLNTNTAASDPVVFVDTNAAGDSGVYRVGLLPNP